jgi:hypothetical protein
LAGVVTMGGRNLLPGKRACRLRHQHRGGGEEAGHDQAGGR